MDATLIVGDEAHPAQVALATEGGTRRPFGWLPSSYSCTFKLTPESQAELDQFFDTLADALVPPDRCRVARLVARAALKALHRRHDQHVAALSTTAALAARTAAHRERMAAKQQDRANPATVAERVAALNTTARAVLAAKLQARLGPAAAAVALAEIQRREDDASWQAARKRLADARRSAKASAGGLNGSRAVARRLRQIAGGQLVVMAAGQGRAA
ncbi:conserved protein of unknown function (plasmid) [Rhodovastum atsumiense]|uniref:Uncharacterized protein n=1 Tax=Rhodovastum atsumiense TaxID=504468 RepID=A0A5M6IU03_9PROT|nr:hypothetical protein [Rhodovastum atsumiense]KAA5611796.1 hypothetical protein F1189_12205 [Rhodovastum atsumiense]CAH2606096.1 conserved protein of unknown function [Rhodovastum atsumiense]